MLVVCSTVGEAQTCLIPNWSIHDNFLTLYIIESAETKAAFGGALINLELSKAFPERETIATWKPSWKQTFSNQFSEVGSLQCSLVPDQRLNQTAIYRSRLGFHARFLRGTRWRLFCMHWHSSHSLQRKLEQLRGILFELRQRGAVSTYPDSVTVMLSDASEVETVGTILKKYEWPSRDGHTIRLCCRTLNRRTS